MIYIVPSLVNYFPINSLTTNGFEVVLKQGYSEATTSEHISSIRKGCNANTLLCVGSYPDNSNELETLACGNCLSITTETEWNTPIFNGNSYWYFTPGYSFGFSPDQTIKQITGDDADIENMLKLSWNLDNKQGGYRSGSTLVSDDSYIKLIFMKHGVPGDFY